MAFVAADAEVVVKVTLAFSLDAVLPVPRFACSTIPCSDAEIALVATEAAVFRGEAGFRGDIGRAKHDAPFEGD